jgi:hypothetical protein
MDYRWDSFEHLRAESQNEQTRQGGGLVAGSPKENRTPALAVRGQCPNR